MGGGGYLDGLLHDSLLLKNQENSQGSSNTDCTNHTINVNEEMIDKVLADLRIKAYIFNTLREI
jgi:hypothetical protein